jgi:hypothetical protein
VTALGVYVKIAFSLVEGVLDVVYGGEVARQMAKESLYNYGILGRFDEDLVDYKRLLESET